MLSHRWRPKKQRVIALLTMSVVVLTNTAESYGEVKSLPKIRVGASSNKFTNTYQYAAVFKFTNRMIFRARQIEVAVGSIATSRESEAFLSIGPVWRVPAWNDQAYFEFGISPTFLSGSTFNNRDTGGNFHFTSSMAIGLKLGRRKANSIALRIQHMSNGGLDSTNPGLDMVGLEFSFGNSW